MHYTPPMLSSGGKMRIHVLRNMRRNRNSEPRRKIIIVVKKDEERRTCGRRSKQQFTNQEGVRDQCHRIHHHYSYMHRHSYCRHVRMYLHIHCCHIHCIHYHRNMYAGCQLGRYHCSYRYQVRGHCHGWCSYQDRRR